jgi:hypothetical protein
VLVEAEDKRWARVKVAESVVRAIETGMAMRNMPAPPGAGVPSPNAALDHAVLPASTPHAIRD